VLLRCADRALDLSTPVVMGVLNVTPDSFSDGGRYIDFGSAVARGVAMLAAGAAVIDVGGESTRPGADPVAVNEELRRVVPVIRELAAQGALVSIDSSKPEVIAAAIAAGAKMVNDVYALRMQGEPRSMQKSPHYEDVVAEVGEFLAARLAACEAIGITRDRLLIDPGFGFGKTLQHNLELLRGLRQLTLQGLPILVGLSRKSMLGTLTGRVVDARLAGSLALAYAALEGGARMIRTHDVAETCDVVKVWSALRQCEGMA
jgi:dihydropteroate synthase